MAAPSPEARDPGLVGCGAALAIGVLTIMASTLAFSLLTGRAPDLGDEWPVFLFQMLIVAAPFAALALAGARGRLPWAVGLALTLAFRGYALFEGVSYQNGIRTARAPISASA